MNITIKTDENDTALLEGFAAATGWSDRSGIKLEDWIQLKISEWITRQARQGRTLAQTSRERDQYIVAVKAASESSKTAIQPPVVSAELASVG